MPRAQVNAKAAFQVKLMSAPDQELVELRDFCAAILASRKKVAPKAPKAPKAAPTSPITEAAKRATARKPRAAAAAPQAEEVIT